MVIACKPRFSGWDILKHQRRDSSVTSVHAVSLLAPEQAGTDYAHIVAGMSSGTVCIVALQSTPVRNFALADQVSVCIQSFGTYQVETMRCSRPEMPQRQLCAHTSQCVIRVQGTAVQLVPETAVKSSIVCMEVQPAGPLLAVCHANGLVAVWDMRTKVCPCLDFRSCKSQVRS